MKLLPIVAIVGLITGACSSIETPKGSSKGYSSARFVKADRYEPYPNFAEDDAKISGMVQTAIRSNFAANGIPVGADNAELVIAYLLIKRNNVSTEMVDSYFGYGRDAMKIMDEAHRTGAVEGKRPDRFEEGAIVIDLIDAKTNKLVYRHYAVRDLTSEPSDSVRKGLVDSAVAEALRPFFR